MNDAAFETWSFYHASYTERSHGGTCDALHFTGLVHSDRGGLNPSYARGIEPNSGTVQSESIRRTAPLEVVGLPYLMERTAGIPEVVIGLIDGPVDTDHSDLVAGSIRVVRSPLVDSSKNATGTASEHGTYIAGILCAKRDSTAPAICPGCTLLVRPIFLGSRPGARETDTPATTPGALADAIVDCVEVGARILNLSVALAPPSPNREPLLEHALDHAMMRGTIVVAAAGNQGLLGGSVITRHSWVVPVVACDLAGRPLALSNLSHSIARHGVMAPGIGVTSLGVKGQPVALGGTSAATAFVTGAIALLWSLFPRATATELKTALTRTSRRRESVVPPRLDTRAAHELMQRRAHV